MKTACRTAIAGLFAMGVAASAGAQITSKVLDPSGASLTGYIPADKTLIQDLRPRFDQRGVDFDGTLRSPAVQGWAIAADTVGGGYTANRTLGDVSLFTGGYHPTEVDLSLPSVGLPVVIGRSYNALQLDGGTSFDSDGPQGWNWSQLAQPELVRHVDGGGVTQNIYLVYGADRYIEFQRADEAATAFKSKNGAAGVIIFSAGDTFPDVYTYIDPRGNRTEFFGFNSAAGDGKGQLWRMRTTDDSKPDVYVGHATSASSAISTGYSGGLLRNMFDASGRKYEFSYASFGSNTRLTKVEAFKPAGGGSWTLVAQVDYDYYGTGESHGLQGDLKRAKTTLKGTSGGDYVRSKYYRYYTSTWSNADGSRGSPHQIKMVLGYEGARQADWDNGGDLDDDYWSSSDSTLKPYADLYLEYNSTADRRIAGGVFNGSCGCSGGTAGEYSFTYSDHGSYSTYIGNSAYDSGWARRVTVRRPDETYQVVQFDEVGQVLGHVLLSGDPGGSPARNWATQVERTSGFVTSVYSPEAVSSSGYTYSTGVFNPTGSGLVTVYGREASGNLEGLRNSVSVKNGAGGTPSMTNSVTLSQRQLDLTSTAVTAVVVDAAATYPEGSALTTSYTYSYWSGTNTDVQYLAAKTIEVTSPTVTTANNGSNSATGIKRYLRKDSTVAFSKDQSGIISYSGRNDYGQGDKWVADADTGGSFNAEDAVSNWPSVGLASAGTEIAATTTATYDDQGRQLTVTAPSVNGTRTSAWSYTVDSQGRLATFAYPRKVSTTYYGPVSYSLVNHVNKPVQRATIKLAGGAAITSTTPSGTDWSGLTESVYDETGSRLEEQKTYTSITSWPGTTTSFATTYDYDNMGRVTRVEDATGTITTTTYDDRGLAVQRAIGTDDSGTGSDNMTIVEKIEFDGSASSSSGNGYLTKRIQDEDGNWSTTGDQRVTEFKNDFRGRAVAVLNPLAPHTVTEFDNSNRPKRVAQYSSTSGLSSSSVPTTTSNRVGLSETKYDERGQVWRSLFFAINQSTGGTISGESLQTNAWFDANGRTIKTHGTQITKTTYDRLGRAISRALVGTTDDGGYYDAWDLTGDKVLEQTTYGLHAATGRARVVTLVQRTHNDSSGTGDLNLNDPFTNADPTYLAGRPQITEHWYDDWDRTIEVVQVGDYDGNTYVGLSSVPSRSDTALRTSTGYDDFGRAKDTTDANGVVQRTVFDFAGRRTKVIDNYVDGTPGNSGNDDDRSVEYTFDSAGRLQHMTRKMPSSSDDQVTEYQYALTKTDSKFAANNILSKTILPEQVTSQAVADRSTTLTFNACGEVLTTTDPSGNVLTNTYDKRGRQTVQHATTIASGFDTRVRKIETTYEARGMVASITQLDVSDDPLDAIEYTYDGWGELSKMVQDPDSGLSGGVSSAGRAEFVQEWTYVKNTDISAGTVRYLTSATQPGGIEVAGDYGTGLDYAMKRSVGVNDVANSVFLSGYKYLGAATVVSVYHGEPDVVSGSFNPSNDSYGGYLDAFNRPLKNQWVKDIPSGGGVATPIYVDFENTFNRFGQQLVTQDNVLSAAGLGEDFERVFDQQRFHDNLRRVTSTYEGKHGFGTVDPVRIENLTRNLAGRITTHQVDLDADSDYADGLPSVQGGDMDDARTYNKRNELRQRDYIDNGYPTTPNTLYPTYDKNGNMLSDSEMYAYVYNPWGQLVEVTGMAKFTYNGLGQKITEQTDVNNAGNDGTADGYLDAYDPVYSMPVDRFGRRLATFRGSDTYPKETFLYHQGGIGGRAQPGGPAFKGGLLLRDRVGDAENPTAWASQAAGDTRGERLYANSDSRGDVVALVSAAGELVEQYRYGPTGVPWGIPLGDVVLDGWVTADDIDAINEKNGEVAEYQARLDLNLDGVVDSTDEDIATARLTNQTGRAAFSQVSVSNRHGRSGLEAVFHWTDDPAPFMWTVGSSAYRADLGTAITFSTATTITRSGNCTTTCRMGFCSTGCELEFSIGSPRLIPIDPGTDLPFPELTPTPPPPPPPCGAAQATSSSECVSTDSIIETFASSGLSPGGEGSTCVMSISTECMRSTSCFRVLTCPNGQILSRTYTGGSIERVSCGTPRTVVGTVQNGRCCYTEGGGTGPRCAGDSWVPGGDPGPVTVPKIPHDPHPPERDERPVRPPPTPIRGR